MMIWLLFDALELREFPNSNVKLEISNTQTYHVIGLESKAVPNPELDSFEIKETKKIKSFRKM